MRGLRTSRRSRRQQKTRQRRRHRHLGGQSRTRRARNLWAASSLCARSVASTSTERHILTSHQRIEFWFGNLERRNRKPSKKAERGLGTIAIFTKQDKRHPAWHWFSKLYYQSHVAATVDYGEYLRSYTGPPDKRRSELGHRNDITKAAWQNADTDIKKHVLEQKALAEMRLEDLVDGSEDEDAEIGPAEKGAGGEEPSGTASSSEGGGTTGIEVLGGTGNIGDAAKESNAVGSTASGDGSGETGSAAPNEASNQTGSGVPSVRSPRDGVQGSAVQNVDRAPTEESRAASKSAQLVLIVNDYVVDTETAEPKVSGQFREAAVARILEEKLNDREWYVRSMMMLCTPLSALYFRAARVMHNTLKKAANGVSMSTGWVSMMFAGGPRLSQNGEVELIG